MHDSLEKITQWRERDGESSGDGAYCKINDDLNS